VTTHFPSQGYRVKDLSKVFFGSGGQPVLALDRVSLDLSPRSFTCVVGPSGCGKSTLLRILGSLETATSGSVATPGDKPSFVFQEHGVFPWYTVLENVAFGCWMAGTRRARRETIAREWIDKVRLTGFERAYPHQLSGGMRQRIAIARAFATGGSSMLMDEPFAALDAQTRLLMQEQLLELCEGDEKTVVFVTHSIEEALLLADRIVLMTARPGRVKETIDVPFARPRGIATEQSAAFAELRSRIWLALRDEAAASVRYS
jgi:NitT/TauT family transport system ATP-binding protein